MAHAAAQPAEDRRAEGVDRVEQHVERAEERGRAAQRADGQRAGEQPEAEDGQLAGGVADGELDDEPHPEVAAPQIAPYLGGGPAYQGPQQQQAGQERRDGGQSPDGDQPGGVRVVRLEEQGGHHAEQPQHIGDECAVGLLERGEGVAQAVLEQHEGQHESQRQEGLPQPAADGRAARREQRARGE